MKDGDKLILAAIGGLSIYFAVNNPRLMTAFLKAWKEKPKDGA